MKGGRVLVVDGDYDTLVALATALRSREHHVALATDGRSGLQHAVETSAEVVVVDRDIPVLDVRTFLDVLRDNPRTSDAHVFLMGAGDPSRLAAIDARAEPIVKPFNAEEIARRVDEVIRQRRAPSAAQEITGDLAQVALFDLLQVFGQSRRTGKLEVTSAGSVGAVWLRDGQVVDARHGGVSGEKALYRVLSLREGAFAFHPDVTTTFQRIASPLDRLMMEAVRRIDERVRMRAELPPLSALVYYRQRSPDLSVTASRVLEQLDEPRSIEELLDLVSSYDLETLQAIRELVDAQAIEIDASQGQVAFCGEDEIAAMRAAAIRMRRAGSDGAVRLGIVARTSADVMRLARALSAIREYVAAKTPPTTAGESMLGKLGSIRFGGTDLDLFVLPHDPTLRPLYAAFLRPARVCLLLGASAAEPELDDLMRTLDVRLVHVPTGFENAAGATFTIRDALGTLPSGPAAY